MPSAPKKWEDKTDREKMDQLHDDLREAHEKLGNLIHDVGRLAARQTTTESTLKEVAKAVEKIEGKVLKKK